MSTGPVGDAWSLLFGSLKELRLAWPSRGWSWDTRLSCVTSSFNSELDAKARTAVTTALSTEWTSVTIQRASVPLRDLAERYLATIAPPADQAFTALNSAFLTDGALVYLPADTEISQPIHLVYVSDAAADGGVTYPRSLVVLDRLFRTEARWPARTGDRGESGSDRGAADSFGTQRPDQPANCARNGDARAAAQARR